MSNFKTYLRALEPGDWQLFNKWHNDDEVFMHTMANKYFISGERDKRWSKELMVKDSDSIFLAVCLKENDIMVGSTSLINIDLRNKKAFVGGINIDKPYQDLKLAFDAFDQVLEYSFNELGLNKLLSVVLDTQEITAHGLRKYGFKEESVLREEIYKLGKFHDVIVFSFLASEYREMIQRKNK